jgi:hypothetical protein
MHKGVRLVKRLFFVNATEGGLEVYMTDLGMKRCSYCGEDVRQETRRCPYCGSILGNGSNEMQVETVTIDTLRETSDTGDAGQTLYGAESEKLETPQVPAAPADESVEERRDENPAGRSERLHSIPHQRVGKDLGNGIKVFLTAVASVVPGVGQLIGVIAALIYMNAEEDADRNSFGRALLAASLIMFVLTCITWLAIASALYNS